MRTQVIIVIVILITALAASAAVWYYARNTLIPRAFTPTTPSTAQPGLSTNTVPTVTPPAEPAATSEPITTVAENLNIPWEVVWLSDQTILITERPGQLVVITGSQRTNIPVPGVTHAGEGGLLGLAPHPQFASNNYLYVYRTTTVAEQTINRVERFRFRNNQLTEATTIIDNIPGASYHDGGRIKFGPDGYLYITTGDAGTEDNAQDQTSPAGKILRLTDTGNIPPGNPFNSAVYSLGHRNSQGLAWDAPGRLWATEHGRSGIASGFDEINLIEAGNNYGWPTVQGDETQSGFTPPAIHSGPNDTWAPAGATIHNDSLFFTGLRGQALYQATITGNQVSNLTQHFTGEFGRLRTVTSGPDGALYLLTNNTDGRGQPQTGDDKLIRIDPSIFN